MAFLRSALALSGILCFVGQSLAANTDRGWNMETLQNIPTAQGLLQISAVGLGGYRIMLQGQSLRELEGYHVEIIDAIPEGNNPSILLVGIQTGGGSCEHQYRILDLTPGKKPHLTGLFGTCNGNPFLKKGEGNSVVINFFSAENDPPATWFYNPAGHRLSHPGQPTPYDY